jgi:hypothetical protein
MATQGFIKYRMPVIWADEHRYLDYEPGIFNDLDQIARWQQMGFRLDKNSIGFLCDMTRTQPDYIKTIVKVFENMGWKDIGVSFFKMTPGAILPEHSDLYTRYVNLFDLHGQEHTIHRAIVFLEDWASGHYSECNRQCVTNWRAGDTIEWQYNTPHSAANLGYTDRYTLQITGHK